MKATESTTNIVWNQHAHRRALRKLSPKQRWRGCIGIAVVIDADANVLATSSKQFVGNESIHWIVVQDIPAFANCDKKQACWATLRQARGRFGMPLLPPDVSEHSSLLHHRSGKGHPTKHYAAFAAVSMVMSKTAQIYRRGWQDIDIGLADELNAVPVDSYQLIEFLPRPYVAIPTAEYETLIKFLLQPTDDDGCEARCRARFCSRRAGLPTCINPHRRMGREQLVRRCLWRNAVRVMPEFIHFPSELIAIAANHLCVDAKLLWQIDPPMKLFCDAAQACLLPPLKQRGWNDFVGVLPREIAYDFTPWGMCPIDNVEGE